jgi:hypothetical protein
MIFGKYIHQQEQGNLSGEEKEKIGRLVEYAHSVKKPVRVLGQPGIMQLHGKSS